MNFKFGIIWCGFAESFEIWCVCVCATICSKCYAPTHSPHYLAQFQCVCNLFVVCTSSDLRHHIHIYTMCDRYVLQRRCRRQLRLYITTFNDISFLVQQNVHRYICTYTMSSFQALAEKFGYALQSYNSIVTAFIKNFIRTVLLLLIHLYNKICTAAQAVFTLMIYMIRNEKNN